MSLRKNNSKADSQNNILWVKWVDPLAPLVNGKRPKPIELDGEDPDFIRAKNTFPHDHPMGQPHRSGVPYQGAAIVSPMGIIPLYEDTLPSALFNFWVGHTNFTITPRLKMAIESVPGVETLDIFTRYRFRLGVARSFREADVKSAVEAAVRPALPSDPLITYLSGRYPFWAVARLPDNRFLSAGGDSREEVLKQLGPIDGAALTCSWSLPNDDEETTCDE